MNEKIKFRFGTDGVRGIIDKGFNERLVTVLTKSTTRHWSRGYGLRHLLVGYDARTKSRTYATIAANVALNHGIDTVMMGKSMLLLDLVFRFGFDLVIQITAGHNSFIYNGSSGSRDTAQEEDTKLGKHVRKRWRTIMSCNQMIR